jgi:hypothetical protein
MPKLPHKCGLIFLKSYSNSNWVFFRGLFKGPSWHEVIKDSTLEFSVLREGFRRGILMLNLS